MGGNHKKFSFFFFYYFQEQNKNLNSKIYKPIQNIFSTKLKFSCLTKKKKKGGLKGSPNILISFSNCLFQKIIFILILVYAKKKVILIGVTHFFVQMHAYTYMYMHNNAFNKSSFCKIILKNSSVNRGPYHFYQYTA